MIGLGKHHKAKRMIGLLVAVIMMLSLPACIRTLEESAVPTEAPAQEITQAATPTAIPAPEPEMPYKGDGSKYVYFTTNERDREWEEDIVYFADHFLDPDSGHAKLIERGCEIAYLNDLGNGYDDWESKYESLFDAELRDEFIKRINRLLLSISEKSESELRLGCAEAAAILNDAHTGVWLFSEKDTVSFYPLKVTPIYTDGVLEAYINAAPEGMEDLLLCRLDAINGVPFSEVLERTARIIQHESITYVQSLVFRADYSVSPSDIIFCNEILSYLGVVDKIEPVMFSFIDPNGAKREVELSCYTKEDSPELAEYKAPVEADGRIGFNLIDSDEADVWYRIIDEGKVLYIRFNMCPKDLDGRVREAVDAAENAGTVKTVILDFRRNPGGFLGSDVDLVRMMDTFEDDCEKYVLIDGGTCSASVDKSVALRRFAKNAVLVGTPAGEPANGWFPGGYITVPNEHITVTLSPHTCNYAWPGNDDPVLMPDIIVYQTLDDYKNGIDSVLKYLIRDSVEATEDDFEIIPGHIYLYGEKHADDECLEKELEIWGKFYAAGARHLFIEYPYYEAEFLNLWMYEDSDDILDKMYDDWKGTQAHSKNVLDFWHRIKQDYPETVFHGVDVGHQYDTIGKRYMAYLREKGLKESEAYVYAREIIVQGTTFYTRKHRDMAYRENCMVENFIREYDGIVGETVMGIFGTAHVDIVALGYLSSNVWMAKLLAEHYGEVLHYENLF